MTETGSDDDESKKDDDKSESQTAEEESVSRLWYKSRDLAELAGQGGEELSKVSFLPFHSIACSCDNTKTLSQCMCA